MPRDTNRPAGPSAAPTASRHHVLVVATETSRPQVAIPPKAASSDELFGPFSEAAFGSALIHFSTILNIQDTENTEVKTKKLKESGFTLAVSSVDRALFFASGFLSGLCASVVQFYLRNLGLAWIGAN